MDFEPQKNKSLKDYTTLHIGGEADYLAEVKDEGELRAALRFAKANTATPPLILGGGSNVLCSDDGYRGLVVINKISGYELVGETDNSVLVRVGGGEIFDEIIQKTITDDYWGLENLSAIPGSVGATPIQNVGAYGVEISSLVESVSAINIKTLEEKNFTSEECLFAYRDSFFKSSEGKEWCVAGVVYRLSKSPKPTLDYKDLQPLIEKTSLSQQQIRDHVIKVRSQKFPDWTKEGTAGSFFKNPIISQNAFEIVKKNYPELPSFETGDGMVKVPLGWILDQICNLRGYTHDNIRLYEKQALVLVVKPGATAKEVEAFVSNITKTVKAKTGIDIEREVLSV